MNIKKLLSASLMLAVFCNVTIMQTNSASAFLGVFKAIKTAEAAKAAKEANKMARMQRELYTADGMHKATIPNRAGSGTGKLYIAGGIHNAATQIPSDADSHAMELWQREFEEQRERFGLPDTKRYDDIIDDWYLEKH